MAQEVILVDTSVLIDYFRKSDKSRSLLRKLVNSGQPLSMSVVTEYEVYVGAKPDQLDFWTGLLERFAVLPLRSAEVRRAAVVQSELKRSRKQMALPDLFIAATVLELDQPIATLNRRHFAQVPGIVLLD